MPFSHRDRLRGIKTFPSLVKYLRDELDWPIESDDFEDLTFDYEPEELGIDVQTATKIESIKQLRPLIPNQQWGIFFVKFEPKRLPVVALRRILSKLIFKKRATAKHSELATWNLNDLLFISNYGEGNKRQINLAHFAENPQKGRLPTLRVLGWDDADRDLKIDYVREEMQTKLRWPDDLDELGQWRETWSSVFTLRYKEVITTSKKLAERLAELATVIRKRVNEVLKFEKEKGPLRKLFQAFREVLIHDLTEDDFADTYAQTIAYGLLSEKLTSQENSKSSLGLGSLKIMNPFLAKLLDECKTIGQKHELVDFDEVGVAEIEDLLNDPQTKYNDILRDFDKLNPEEDPVIHFYEHFLREYDSEKRVQRGVFYTPKPVVSFIVRSVDEILSTEFGLEDGLADITTWSEMVERHKDLKIPLNADPEDPFVQILDPATGTGTFLVEVIDLIYKTMIAKWLSEGQSGRMIDQLWNDYVPKHLLPRLYGFELMMAPYAIAHMKIGLKLYETGYRFHTDKRAQVFLTNSLEPPHDSKSQIQLFVPEIAREAHKGNKVKGKAPITVVIGNPPYANFGRMNKNPWISSLLDDYKKNLRERKINIDDDFIKFIRFGQWRIDLTGTGVLGFITNHTYIDGVTHRRMRESLLNSTPEIFILDLHGSVKKGGIYGQSVQDENVFDIQQGVSVSVLVKRASLSHSPTIWYGQLLGPRPKKYQILMNSTINMLSTTSLKVYPDQYFFVPSDRSLQDEYNRGVSIDEIFQIYSSGIDTKCDRLLINYDDYELTKVIKDILRPEKSAADIRKDYDIPKRSTWELDRVKTATFHKKKISPILYRLYQNHYTYFDKKVLSRAREAVMEHMVRGNNLGLICTRQMSQTGGKWCHLGISRKIIERCAISNRTKEGNYLFPLYQYRGQKSVYKGKGCTPNIASSFSNLLSKNLNISWIDSGSGNLEETVGPEDILHYMYAQLHSNTYRNRYIDFLKINFPRIFLTNNLFLFRKLCKIGVDLVALHLLEDDDKAGSWDVGSSPFTNPITTFIGEGLPEVAKGHPKYRDGKVYINKICYFNGVPEPVWNFYIGGYQVCHKWLKDHAPRGGKNPRPGRILSSEDIAHYQKIVIALNETIRIMDEIDEVIEEHGGWPDAFSG